MASKDWRDTMGKRKHLNRRSLREKKQMQSANRPFTLSCSGSSGSLRPNVSASESRRRYSGSQDTYDQTNSIPFSVRILHIEDNEADADLILHQIKRAFPHAQIDHVFTGKDYEQACRHCGRYDLILSDYRLPDTDGDKTLALARELCPDVPFIMVTGELGEDRAIETVKRGAWNYVLKDNLKRLVPAIEAALAEARLRREASATQDKLRESEARYRSIVEGMHALLFTADRRGRLTYVNEAATRILGYSREELIGTFYLRYVHPQDRALVHAGYRDQMAGKHLHSLPEFRYVSKHGTIGWLSFYVNTVHDANGEIGGLTGVATNVTERKRTEEALRQSEERYRSLVVTASQVLYRMSPDWKVMLQLQSRGYLANTEVSNPNWLYEYIPVGEQERVRAAIERAIRTKNVFELEHQVIAANGTIGWTLSRAVPILNNDGEITEWFGFATDITERKRTEEALQESETRLRQMLNVGGIGALMFDPVSGIALDANDTFLQMTGYSRHQIASGEITWRTMTPPEFVQISLEQMEHLRQTGRIGPYEKQYFRVDGSREWMLFTGAELGDGTVVEYCIDISERKRAEEELRLVWGRYESMFNSVREGFAHFQGIYDNHGRLVDIRVLEINPAGARISGVERNKQIGKTWREVWPGTDEQLFAVYERADQTGEPVNYEDNNILTGRTYDVVINPIRSAEFIVTYHDVTERKQAEGALRQSEAKLQAVIEEAPLAIVLTSPTGEIVFRNPRFDQLWGRAPHLTTARTYSDVYEGYHLDGRPIASEEWPGARAVLNGEVIENEVYEIVHASGERVTCWFGAAPIRNASGEILGGLVVFRDITKERRTEEALRRSEAILSQAGEMARLGAWSVEITSLDDLSANPLWWSDETYRIFGYEPRSVEVSNALFFQHVHPGDRKNVSDAVARAIAEHQPYQVEHRIFLPNGDERCVREHAVIEFDVHNRPRRIIGAVQDITERKKSEEALRESEARFRDLANNISQLAWMANPDGWIFWYNQRWFDYTGTTLEEMQGWGWQKVHHPAHLGRVTEKFKHHLGSGEVWEDTFPLRNKTDEYGWFLSRAVPIRNEHGEIVRWFGTNTDISERKRAEDEIRKLNEELEQRVEERTAQLRAAANELEAFSYSVSHDLRAPLRAISGFAKILVEDATMNLSAEQNRYLATIRENAARMGEMMNRLLDLSRLGRQAISRSKVDMNSIISTVVGELLAGLAKERKPTIVVDELPSVYADPVLIRQVVENLISNAIKFTQHAPAPWVKIGSYLYEETLPEVVFVVSDNGIGFDPREKDKPFLVFERLHQADRFEGTGIGLSIVKRIIERHGGRVWAESEGEGKGATFFFSLPHRTTKTPRQ